jgi:hypothetical protein
MRNWMSWSVRLHHWSWKEFGHTWAYLSVWHHSACLAKQLHHWPTFSIISPLFFNLCFWARMNLI